MPASFFLVNAFTTPTSPFSGNQAAVVLLKPDHPKAEDDEWKALTARDFGFSETSFVTEQADGKWGLRWWTPAVEVVLCGHATLAAAAALFQLRPDIDSLTFVTRWSGELTATRADSKGIAIILPGLTSEIVAQIQSSDVGKKALEVLSAAVPHLPSKAVKNVFAFPWGTDASCIIELEGEELELEKLKVDAKIMEALGKGILILTQLILSGSSSGKLRIRSRVFAPGCGIDEDPVTGSAHAYLASYFTSAPIFGRLPQSVTAGIKPEGLVLDAYQASERGGKLECSLVQGGEAGRVRVVGTAGIWGHGELSI